MQLSKSFTLAELTVTKTGLPNVPGAEEVERLRWLAEEILQPIRDRFGPIRINSGFRTPAVNLAAGSKTPSSQHIKGEAADIVPLEARLTEVFDWIVKESGLFFGQCILEKGTWIHISLPREGKPNQRAMIFDGKDYKLYA